MSYNDKCCSARILQNQVNHSWQGEGVPIFPFSTDQLTAITGYVLNNNSSNGPVTVNFLRGGTPLPFSLTVEPGDYKSFTIVGIDTIKINPENHVATGELNILVNFSL